MSAASVFRKGDFTPENRSVLFFLWFGYVFLYMTRINISVAIPALTAALWLALLRRLSRHRLTNPALHA